MKKILKNRVFLCTLTALIFGTIGVSATTYFPSNNITYDNTESGITSTNVQGAIDELYNTCKTLSIPTTSVGNQEIQVVTSGDGLYKDEYEEGKYTYKGANPNNYITFNGETAGWRIISIEADKSLKIMKIDSIGRRNYDNLSNNWARPASLNTYLNGTYYNELNQVSKNQIINHNWNIGGASFEGAENLAVQIEAENNKTWSGKIALITISEYLRANNNKILCETSNLISKNYIYCANTNWINTMNKAVNNNSNAWWTLTPFSSSSTLVNSIFFNGNRGTDDCDEYDLEIRPVVYIDSNLKLSGSGTLLNPYILSV